MSAVPLPRAGAPLDRRQLLRLGLTASVGVAVASLAPDVISAVASTATSSSVAPALPSAASWEAVIGHDLVTTLADGTRSVVQVVDVRATATDPLLRGGEAYSLLLDGPSLPDASHHVASLRHEAIGTVTLTILPVNADASWEAVVDTRRPLTS